MKALGKPGVGGVRRVERNCLNGYIVVVKIPLPLWAALMPIAALAAAPVASFERYQIILDRQPFGPLISLPSGENTTSAPPAAVVALGGEALGMRACSLIMVDGEGPRVGLVEIKTSKSYFLFPGETQDGIRVVSADFEKDEVVIQRGVEMAVLKLKEAGTAEKKTAPGAGLTAPRTRLGSLRPPGAPAASAPVQPPVAVVPAPPVPRLHGEELEKHLKQYQMEVIRKGLPPLPIPLTPEMDAQLVSEGVLPPQGPTVIQRGDAQIIIQAQ